MANEWRNRASNTIRGRFRLLFLILGFCFVLTNPSNVVASGCGILENSTATLLRFVDMSEDKKEALNFLCKKVNDGNLDVGKARLLTHGLMLRYAACRSNRINSDYEKHLKEERNVPNSVVLANEHFCKITNDPGSRMSEAQMDVLLKQVDWLRTETFCNATSEFFNPGSFWLNLFMPDIPSLTKFSEESDSLCEELRNDNITYNYAVYRWEVAYEEFNKRSGPEMVKKAGKDLSGPVNALLDLLK